MPHSQEERSLKNPRIHLVQQSCKEEMAMGQLQGVTSNFSTRGLWGRSLSTAAQWLMHKPSHKFKGCFNVSSVQLKSQAKFCRLYSICEQHQWKTDASESQDFFFWNLKIHLLPKPFLKHPSCYTASYHMWKEFGPFMQITIFPQTFFFF